MKDFSQHCYTIYIAQNQWNATGLVELHVSHMLRVITN